MILLTRWCGERHATIKKYHMKTPLEYEADILEQCINDLQIVVNGMHERGEYNISKALEELNFKIEELVKDRINS